MKTESSVFSACLVVENTADHRSETCKSSVPRVCAPAEGIPCREHIAQVFFLSLFIYEGGGGDPIDFLRLSIESN